MDREIGQDVRNRRTARRVITAIVAVAAVVFLVAATMRFLKPSLRRADVQTARVTRGPVDAVLQAAGTVLPESETVISSPIEARVLRIGRRAGERLRQGDEILTLDTSVSRLELERLKNQVAQKESDLAQTNLKNEETLASLGAQIEQKKLDAEILHFKSEQNSKLAKSGLAATQDAMASAAAAKKGDIELRQLQEALERAKRTAAAELASRQVELRNLRNDRDESQRQLELAMTRADRDGVLTWVPPEVGVTVRRGDVIARMADLSSFHVVGTIADVHASQLAAGMPVHVRIDDGAMLDGVITSVDPRIESGTARFIVELDRRDDRRLRNNLRVDLFVVTGRHTNVLRIRRGALDGGLDALYVVRDGVAFRTPARLGLAGADDIEIVSGVREGDEVVISNMADYQNINEIRIR
jgi:HlyD family secretion protein